MVRKAVRVEGGVALYPIHMGVHERREELCQRE